LPPAFEWHQLGPDRIRAELADLGISIVAGWGESGGTYPFLFLRLTFGTRRQLILLAGFFVLKSTLCRTISRLTYHRVNFAR
jgi:hypothetical protein